MPDSLIHDRGLSSVVGRPQALRSQVVHTAKCLRVVSREPRLAAQWINCAS